VAAELMCANLSGADLSEADLFEADVNRAVLLHVNDHRANLDCENLDKAVRAS
jgi:uncharacterized protein YjbI with pentapeptide repeats